jgi:hypothetical protein
MITINRAQRCALYKLYQKDPDHKPTYRRFRSYVQLPPYQDGSIMIFWCGMWVCIELDGYAHT